MKEHGPAIPERNPGIPFDPDVLHHPDIDRNDLYARISRLRNRIPIRRDERITELQRIISVMDLTSLSEDDTPASIIDLCSTATHPIAGSDPSLHVAAVCVWHHLTSTAKDALQGTGVRVAAVAGGFPAPLDSMDERLHQIHEAVSAGSDEIDLVITRELARREEWKALYDEIVILRTAAATARIKTILATGDLEQPAIVWKASMTCMMAGADFVKTSTGREQVNATLPAGVVMADAIRIYHTMTGSHVGLKPAGGIKTVDHAMEWIRLADQELGVAWATPARFRIGASSLMDDVTSELESPRTL